MDWNTSNNYGGVTIESHSIIGAGAIVTKDVPAYSVVAGSPARIVKKRNENRIIKE